MTLNDEDIKTLVANSKLIDPCEEDNIQNCRYYLKVGRVFMPETGHELLLNAVVNQTNGVSVSSQPQHWSIEPSDTLVVMTEEVVNIPLELLATYGPLNHLAQQGLLLVNASIIEPGYNGPLSCYFVNFSSKAIHLAPGDAIAKICFHKLTKPPKNPKPLVLSRKKYASTLSEAAFSYPKSFLNIGGLEKRVADATTKAVNKSILFGGIFIAVLAFFNTLEPFLNKQIWDKAGVVSNSSRAEIQAMKSQLDLQAKELADERQRMELVDKQRAEHYEKMVLQLQEAGKKAGKQ